MVPSILNVIDPGGRTGIFTVTQCPTDSRINDPAKPGTNNCYAEYHSMGADHSTT